MTDNYNDSNIITLEWYEHIRLRPGMYIGRVGDGSSHEDGIYILLKEVIDNSIDEFMQGHGKTIDVSIKDHMVSVRDYGRGIPLNKMVDCVSKINTGGKFNSEVSNPQQVIKAMLEAEAYDGPSLIIAYAPCINHGLKAKGGMGKAQAEIKKAVECGYWQLYRYNPTLENPMTIDSKDPTGDYQEFLKGEVRYTSLAQQFPEAAAKLFVQQEEDAKVRLDTYKKMAGKE